jgi:hypothetical protein
VNGRKNGVASLVGALHYGITSVIDDIGVVALAARHLAAVENVLLDGWKQLARTE